MRDASCRGTPLLEHCRNLAPPIEAPQADLAADHEPEKEDQRRVLDGQATLSLHAAPKLLVGGAVVDKEVAEVLATISQGLPPAVT